MLIEKNHQLTRAAFASYRFSSRIYKERREEHYTQ